MTVLVAGRIIKTMKNKNEKDAKNIQLDNIRHSLAHILAMAVLEKDPEVKLAIGPVIDNGFYYDFLFSKSVCNDDLKEIEKTMKKIIGKKMNFTGKEISIKDAKKLFENQPFKLELIDEFCRDSKKLTIYKTGNFTDLCRGGHIKNSSEINPESFKISHLAGAYWRGSEKNPMLTRIYGLAFSNKKELDEHTKQMEEAEKRDHRKLGKEMEIFMFDDEVGPGLPMWLPNGGILIEELEKLAKETEFKDRYVRVRTPHIAKESLYLRSGHLPYYQDTMYPPMEYEGGKYYLKAMNCPHHHKIFGSKPRSYKEMPIRMAEYGTVYRHEKSGELFGLMRVRSLSMNDAHIYCTKSQFAEEFRRVNKMYLKYFDIFGISKYVMRFSTHEPKRLGEKYLNEPKLWKETEDMVRDILVKSKIPYVEIPDEAAFYGPKIDVQVWSAIGKEFSLATNQVDFAGSQRFNLKYMDKNGKEESPIIIHRAPLGTHERFIGFLIEHFAGVFPLWLSPVQIKILPVSEKFNAYADKICQKLTENCIRAHLDSNNETLGKKVREGKKSKTPYLVIIGEKELNSATLTTERRDGKSVKNIGVDEFIGQLKEEISSKDRSF